MANEPMALIKKVNFFLGIPDLNKPLNSLIAGFKSSKLGLTG
jgi:hypothetical protein